MSTLHLVNTFYSDQIDPKGRFPFYIAFYTASPAFWRHYRPGMSTGIHIVGGISALSKAVESSNSASEFRISFLPFLLTCFAVSAGSKRMPMGGA